MSFPNAHILIFRFFIFLVNFLCFVVPVIEEDKVFEKKKRKEQKKQTGGDGRLVMAIGLVDDEKQTEEETEGQRKKERKEVKKIT